MMMHGQVLARLCTACVHGNDCTDPQLSDAAEGGVTCLSYTPDMSGVPSMRLDHIMALPDREPCADCACRKGTQPNGTHHSMADFTASVDQLKPFLCHSEGAGRICAGWLRAVKRRQE